MVVQRFIAPQWLPICLVVAFAGQPFVSTSRLDVATGPGLSWFVLLYCRIPVYLCEEYSWLTLNSGLDHLFVYMPFLCPTYYKAPCIDVKQGVTILRNTVSNFVAPNLAFYRLALCTDWLTLDYMTPCDIISGHFSLDP